MDWTFITSFIPNKMMCDKSGNCERAVPALSHKVEWKSGGDIRIVSSERRTGPGMEIDRANLDAAYVLNPVDQLVARGVLELGAQGGTFSLERRGKSRKKIDVLPASLTDLLDAIGLVKSFEMSFSQLNHCGVRQVVAMMVTEDRTEAEQQVVDAARYLGSYDRLQGEAQYYPFREAPEDQQEEVERKSIHASAMQVGLRMPLRDVTDAYLNGTPMSDEDVLTQSANVIARLEKPAGENYETIRKDILETRRVQLLAAIRLSARFSALQAKGHVLQEAVCSDITLTQ